MPDNAGAATGVTSNLMPENLSCWLYVSRCVLADEIVEEAMDNIVSVSRRRNADLHVTGALLFTGHRFAQFLEGPAEAVKELMISISRDARHNEVATIVEEVSGERRFAGWSLAYAGTSLFIANMLDEVLLPGTEARFKSERLIRLLEGFSGETSIPA